MNRYIPFTMEILYIVFWEQLFCDLVYGTLRFDILGELDLNLKEQGYK